MHIYLLYFTTEYIFSNKFLKIFRKYSPGIGTRKKATSTNHNTIITSEHRREVSDKNPHLDQATYMYTSRPCLDLH